MMSSLFLPLLILPSSKSLHHGLVHLLLLLLPVQGLRQGLDCNGHTSAVCLTQGYSTFDLPLRSKPNLIKIGIYAADMEKVVILPRTRFVNSKIRVTNLSRSRNFHNSQKFPQTMSACPCLCPCLDLSRRPNGSQAQRGKYGDERCSLFSPSYPTHPSQQVGKDVLNLQ